MRKERTYQNYIATAAEIITYNMAHREEMRYLTISYNDLFNSKEPSKEEHEQTIEEIKKKQKIILNKIFKGGEKK